jgi:hypothetical protein
MKYCALAVLLVMGMAFADNLNVLVGVTAPLVGPNCRGQGGPNYYDVDAIVTNPSAVKTIRITYLYYNASSGGLEDGGKACDVMAGGRLNCKFRIYTISGGKNGTDAIPFKVIGWVGELCGNGQYCAGSQEYDVMLNVTVNHYTSLFEENVMSKLAIAAKNYAVVGVNYTGDCYNKSGLDILQSASSEMVVSSSQLSVCDIVDALNMANDAINKVGQAAGYTKPVCVKNQTMQNESNTTPLQPPKKNNTQTTPNESVNGTGNNASSNQSLADMTSALAKGCIPFCILVALLVVAVWSEKRVNA